MIAQERVAELTRERGYREGWTAEQFVARQVVKLVEELGELAGCIGGWPPWQWRAFDHLWTELPLNAFDARRIFDNVEKWREMAPQVEDLERLKGEACDLLVVLFNLADAIGELQATDADAPASKKGFDLVEEAVKKTAGDVERGVR